MADHRLIQGALPWYAAQTLDDDERRNIEQHLATCGDCRNRLAEIRRFAELGAGVPTERALEHVAPGLLVEYAEDPERLDAETTLWIEGRLAACATCRDAYENLKRVGPAEAGVEPKRDGIRLWDLLAGTLLRPAPALAYLLIAAVGLPLLWFMRVGDDPAATAPIIAISGERTLREQQPATRPIPIDIRAPGQTLILELVTDLAEDDLRPGVMGFDVELTRNGQPVWTVGRDGRDFVLRDGRAVLPLTLETAALSLQADYRVTIRARKDGDPLDGQALFVRHLRLRRK